MFIRVPNKVLDILILYDFYTKCQVIWVSTFSYLLRLEQIQPIDNIIMSLYRISLEQAPQTRGPRAACGPQEGSMRPSNNSFLKQETMIS
jgi:hypothetical protein